MTDLADPSPSRLGPVILASRSLSAFVPFSAYGNVAWSDDGQCLFVTKRGVSIFTPHVLSSLPIPPQYLDLDKDDEETLAKDAGPGPSKAKQPDAAPAAPAVQARRRRPRRPEGGEVPMWMTGMEVDPGGSRDASYGWTGQGNASTALVDERDSTCKRAIWSPSGLSDLGGCLLVVMTSTLQVSVYAPRRGAASNQWDEIADLTYLTKSLFPKKAKDQPPSVPEVLQMRATAFAWSKTVPVPDMLGHDGSLLAVSNRAGDLAFWTYGSERRFKRDQLVALADDWVTHMAWSGWHVQADGSCLAHLALALTNGYVSILPVRRIADVASKTWKTEIGSLINIDSSSKRAVTAIAWVNSALIWTKSGTVHLRIAPGTSGYAWSGVREIRLGAAGGWASATGLGTCVGIQSIDTDALLITLSSLTNYIILDLRTNPKLAPIQDSHALSLASREVFLEMKSVQQKKKIIPDMRAITASTGGWAGIGDRAAFWTAEAVNFHDLSNATDGKRRIEVTIADLSSDVPIGDSDLATDLKRTIEQAASVLDQSPLCQLMPIALRVVADTDREALIGPILGVFHKMYDPADEPSPAVGLLGSFWSSSTQDQIRLWLSFAHWVSRFMPQSSTSGIPEMLNTLEHHVDRYNFSRLVRWAASRISTKPSLQPNSTDITFLRLLVASYQDISDDTVNLAGDISAISSYIGLGLASTDSGHIGDPCPVCGGQVQTRPDGTTACDRNHEWARCSVTRFLVTEAAYRICTSCPAVALLPTRLRRPHVAVDKSGRDTDWQRFEKASGASEASGDEMVQEALEAAVVCVRCGGRWARTM